MTVQYSESFSEALEREPDPEKFWEAVDQLRAYPTEGVKRLKQLSREGSALSMYFVGEAYLRGDGVDQDVEQGIAWLKRGADNGSIEAEFQLGCSYWALGDVKSAISVFEDLCKKGFSPAMYSIARLYLIEESVKSFDSAIKFFKMAEKSGHLMAKREICHFMVNGKLGKINIILGFLKWIFMLVPALILIVRFPESDRLRV